MRKSWTWMAVAGVAGVITGCASQAQRAEDAAEASRYVYVDMTTNMGHITLELDHQAAPVSVDNFMSYARSGAYDGTIFHRVIKEFVIQGGGYSTTYIEQPHEAAIINEWQNGLKNTRGSIGMARDEAPDTATREFYINCRDNPKLDTARDKTGHAGYAVFGRVIAGMDVVDAIRSLPTRSIPDPKDPASSEKEWHDVPMDPPVILSVKEVTAKEAHTPAKKGK